MFVHTAALDPGFSHGCVVLSFKLLKCLKHEQIFCHYAGFFIIIFAGVFPSVPHWRELQHRPELKLASRVLTEDRLRCIIYIYPEQFKDGTNRVTKHLDFMNKVCAVF